jgi:hypothetical protein
MEEEKSLIFNSSFGGRAQWQGRRAARRAKNKESLRQIPILLDREAQLNLIVQLLVQGVHPHTKDWGVYREVSINRAVCSYIVESNFVAE